MSAVRAAARVAAPSGAIRHQRHTWKEFVMDIDDGYYEWELEQWHATITTTTDQVIGVIKRVMPLATIDHAGLMSVIDTCSVPDDPEWSFDLGNLIDKVLDTCEVKVTDKQYELLEYELDDLFPLR